MVDIWGATPEEWKAAKRLAFRDLLPVVSNPGVQLGKFSKMKGLGKTPSLVIATDDGPRAIGFRDWTEHTTTAPNIEAWSAIPDHGLCIQTRLYRAIDIDRDDTEHADEIEAFFTKRLGPAPVRFREGSARRILLYRVVGDVRKASFPVSETVGEGGRTKRELVELLGEGQQFVAAGTHVNSGTRYAWRDGFPKPADVKDLDADRLIEVFTEAHEKFSCGDMRMSGRRDATLPEDLDVEDDVAKFLVDSDWPTYSCERGQLYLECPGKHLHSTDSGETETSWLLAGTGQYRNGHFSCRHESCKELIPTDDAFFKAVGYKGAKADDFEDETTAPEREAQAPVPVSPKAKELDPRGKLPLPGFRRNGKGLIEATLANVTRALLHPEACGVWLAWDEFTAQPMIAHQPGEWRPFTDADAVELRIELQQLPPDGFDKEISKELMRDAMVKVCNDRRIDTAQMWLDQVVPKWDGVSRLRRFWPDYMQTADTPYTRALGLYSWTAQIGRILEPGAKVDMVPVLVSPEGYLKSTALMTMVPDFDFFASLKLDMRDEELARLMKGVLVAELEELRGVGSREGEAVKAWVTRRFEKYRLLYREETLTWGRRLVLYGTTNDYDFLSPHVGERRWLPVEILRRIDIAAIARDRLQLWAEARAIYDVDGICFARVEQLAKAERAAFKPDDEWEIKISDWLSETDDLAGGKTWREIGVRADQVLEMCIGLDMRTVRKVDQMRVARVLSTLGMERVQGWIGSRNVKVWRAAK